MPPSKSKSTSTALVKAHDISVEVALVWARVAEAIRPQAEGWPAPERAAVEGWLSR